MALVVLWATRRGRVLTRSDSRWDRLWTWVAVLTPLMPVFGAAFGWIFTETGRQPWLVFGMMTTATGVSPSVSAGEVLTSMTVFTLLYGALAVVEIKLFLHYVRKGAEEFVRTHPSGPDRRRRPARLRVLTGGRHGAHDRLVHPHRGPLDGVLRPRGFDFGVGMLLPVLGRGGDAADTERRRRVMINTIGPLWDGNEVWLLTAGGATFAAFPHWYATLFSGFYLPLLLILVALIVRGPRLRVPPQA